MAFKFSFHSTTRTRRNETRFVLRLALDRCCRCNWQAKETRLVSMQGLLMTSLILAVPMISKKRRRLPSQVVLRKLRVASFACRHFVVELEIFFFFVYVRNKWALFFILSNDYCRKPAIYSFLNYPRKHNHRPSTNSRRWFFDYFFSTRAESSRQQPIMKARFSCFPLHLTLSQLDNSWSMRSEQQQRTTLAASHDLKWVEMKNKKTTR